MQRKCDGWEERQTVRERERENEDKRGREKEEKQIERETNILKERD